MVGMTENVDGAFSTGLETVSSPAFPYFCQKKQTHPAGQWPAVRSCCLSCAGRREPHILPSRLLTQF